MDVRGVIARFMLQKYELFWIYEQYKPELDERGISQKEFAKILGTQPSHLSEVLNGKRALTTELAVKIENAIGLPAKILLSAQTQYELESTVAAKLKLGWRVRSYERLLLMLGAKV